MSATRWMSRSIGARSWETVFSSIILLLFLVTFMFNSETSILNQVSRDGPIQRHHNPTKPLSCGYRNCPKTKGDLINIHLVPHSHDDPGYKKTVEEYFYGLRNDIQNVSISKILSNVINQLTLNKERKFVYVEMIYFWKWWQIQTESTREIVRDLVRNGRFEFLNGGWCINDEATTNYADIIDQMSLGLNFLSETFGECGRPKVAMQADTFGHSREQARLSSLMGFDALFLGRVDREDKKRRIEAKEMEMIWYGSDLPGNHPSIFTGITYNIFDPPPGFCFDNICEDKKNSEPINDGIDSNNNLEKRVDEFIAYCMKQADAYKTNNIVVYMGSDYTYENAEVWFSNMDKLIKHVNNRQKDGSPYNMFYSTPACYVKAINEAKVTWPTKKDDFFPYHWELSAYWTGYFSSRPTLKYMIRQSSSLLQACKQMASVLKLSGAEDKGDLSVMKDAMAVMQHHGGITGTHSQRVHDDYVRVLHKGVQECRKTTNSYYQAELPVDGDVKDFKIHVSYCQLNMSQCDVTDQKGSRFIVNVYNPLGQYLDKYIRVPVSRDQDFLLYNIRVLNSNGKSLPSQLMPIPSFVRALPGRNSSATHELVFLATRVPPLGSLSYYVETPVSRGMNKDLSIPFPLWDNVSLPTDHINDLKISNEKLSIVVSKDTGLMKSVTLLGKQMSLDQQFFWYNGNGDNCSFTTKTASGAYVFNPLNNSAMPIKMESINITIYRGNLVEEIHQRFNDYIGQIIRLYKGKDYIEFDWVIGPVPIKDGIGKEIITRYSTDFKNNGQFYTDANGRQNILRTRNKRQTYKLSGNDPVASNYYPITSHSFLTDYKTGYRMNVLTDRAQGGASIEDGQLELLIHRRLVQQDLCRFQEPLDETAYGKGLVVRGTHKLFFRHTKNEDSYKPGSSTLRSLVLEQSREPLISFISTKYTFDQWLKFFVPKLQLLSRPLPENVKLLTFEPRPGYEGEYILRLEHIYDVGEHPVLSSPTEVSLKGLFKGCTISQIEETTLDANLFKSDSINLSWKSMDKDADANYDYNTSSGTAMDRIKLMPMEIRTFIIKLFAK